MRYFWIPITLFTGLALGAILNESEGRLGGTVLAESPPLPPVPTARGDRPLMFESFEQVVARITPSVVSVDAKKSAQGSTKNKSQEESGSGVIARIDGSSVHYVITNNHVIAGARVEEISVTLADGRVCRPVRLLADPESDVALLALDAPNLPAAELADSDRVQVGQWVLAFGSPFGLTQTVTHGIISARNRGQISLGSTIRIKEFLQTDAAINPGSSGGPLVGMDGRVLGINTAIASNNGNNSGVAFAIPINLVKRIGKELIERGSVYRGYLGVQLAPALEPAEALRLGLDKVRGALVELVHPDSPAAMAGLRKGDVILQLENIDLRDENHLINLVSDMPANQKVRLSIWRDKSNLTVDVVIGEWPSGSSVRR